MLLALSSWALLTPAQAPAQTVEDRLAAMERLLAAQAEQIARQQAELADLRGRIASSPAPAPIAAGAPVDNVVLSQAVEQQQVIERDRTRVGYVNARPTIQTPDGRNTLTFRSLVQMDAAHYIQNAEGPLGSDFRRGSVGATANRETNAARDLSDGAYFRRARLGIEGTMNRDFGYRLIAELGGSGTEGPARINDAWISYTGLAPFSFQIGAFSPPANMDDGVSSEDTLFSERASAAELSRALAGGDGRLGAGVRIARPRWMGALTYTSRTVNDAEVFDSQSAVIGRVGALVATSSDYNVHIGASGTYVITPADQGSSAAGPRSAIRFRDRPEIRVDSTRLIDTGALEADHAHVAGLEFGANWKNLYVQAEHFWYGVDRPGAAGPGDPRFTGAYVQASWVMTGESRRYNAANGAFQPPRPATPLTGSGGLGALELAARYSTVDLDFNEGAAGAATPAGGVRGGQQDIITVGLNWYLNTNVRLTFDYMDVKVDRLNPAGPGNLTPFGTAPSTPPIGAQIGQDMQVVVVRSQFAF